MSTPEHHSNRAAKQGQKLRLAAASLVSALALGAMAALAFKMVSVGRGLEVHHSFWLVEDSWVGFLVFAAACVIAIAGGFIWRILQQRREDRAWQAHEAKWAGRHNSDE
jgi:protein-S-isoprenylcysteine O-methyltransferase Ste14